MASLNLNVNQVAKNFEAQSLCLVTGYFNFFDFF